MKSCKFSTTISIREVSTGRSYCEFRKIHDLLYYRTDFSILLKFILRDEI
jgi:hypothetical protein